MDMITIGKFIASCRKEKGLTQAQLAERLGISDRAVSKWETGRSMPDSSIMLELCDIIGITVNDLLTGRKTTMENYKEIAEKNLLMLKQNEERSNKALLGNEIVIGVISCATLAICITAAIFAAESVVLQAVFIILGMVIFLIGMHYAMLIETKAGYYECAECGHRYIPSVSAMYLAPHMGRTRKMRCPECGKRSWQKKVLTKEAE